MCGNSNEENKSRFKSMKDQINIAFLKGVRKRLVSLIHCSMSERDDETHSEFNTLFID